MAKMERTLPQQLRSRSQIIELALEEYLRKHSGTGGEIVTSGGRFHGSFKREETYALCALRRSRAGSG